MSVVSLERAVSSVSWSAVSISQHNARIASAFSIDSIHDTPYISLKQFDPDTNTKLTESEIDYLSKRVQFSYLVESFAAFMYERKRKLVSTDLPQAVQSFIALIIDESDDDALWAQYVAGNLKLINASPFLRSNKATLLPALGLPVNASEAVFDGAESTPVPNPKPQIFSYEHRFLSPRPFATNPTTDTIFNSAGKLIAYRLGERDSGVDFSAVGSASIADTYYDSDISIGRWNYGYEYSQGVKINQSTNEVIYPQNLTSAVYQGKVYATGIPAKNFPSCGSVKHRLVAQTKPLSSYDSSLQLKLHPESKLSFQYSNNSAYVGFDLILVDAKGVRYNFQSVGGADNPTQLVRNNEFESSNGILLPSGESLEFRGLLAGDKGASSVITVSSNIITTATLGLSAAFKLSEPLQDCFTPTFALGSVSPIPTTGEFYIGIGGRYIIDQALSFLADGTPKSVQGGIQSSGFEKSGNHEAGIGIVVPPFPLYYGEFLSRPVTYLYAKYPDSTLQRTGSATFVLTNATPSLQYGAGGVLLSANRNVNSAVLDVYFDEYPIGASHPWYGTCAVFVNGGLALTGLYYRDSGQCGLGSDTSYSFTAAIAGGSNTSAVLSYGRSSGGTTSETSILLKLKK